jgi:hypothetical protein
VPVLFPRKIHTNTKRVTGVGASSAHPPAQALRDLLKRLEDVYWRYAFLAVFVCLSLGLVMLFVQVPCNRIVNKLRLLFFSSQRAPEKTQCALSFLRPIGRLSRWPLGVNDSRRHGTRLNALFSPSRERIKCACGSRK